MKWRKTRNKKEWQNENGVKIRYNSVFNHYSVEKRTFFAFADTLEDAKRIAVTDYRFSKLR